MLAGNDRATKRADSVSADCAPGFAGAIRLRILGARYTCQFEHQAGGIVGLAERCGLAPSLSQMFRQKAIEEGARLIGTGFLFLNLHPAEMGDDQLISSLRALAGPTNW